jgi:hypothetical protein
MNDDTILSPVNIIERKLSCKEEKLNKGCNNKIHVNSKQTSRAFIDKLV